MENLFLLWINAMRGITHCAQSHMRIAHKQLRKNAMITTGREHKEIWLDRENRINLYYYNLSINGFTAFTEHVNGS